jgi:hypothetical protein
MNYTNENFYLHGPAFGGGDFADAEFGNWR